MQALDDKNEKLLVIFEKGTHDNPKVDAIILYNKGINEKGEEIKWVSEIEEK